MPVGGQHYKLRATHLLLQIGWEVSWCAVEELHAHAQHLQWQWQHPLNVGKLNMRYQPLRLMLPEYQLSSVLSPYHSPVGELPYPMHVFLPIDLHASHL